MLFLKATLSNYFFLSNSPLLGYGPRLIGVLGVCFERMELCEVLLLFIIEEGKKLEDVEDKVDDIGAWLYFIYMSELILKPFKWFVFLREAEENTGLLSIESYSKIEFSFDRPPTSEREFMSLEIVDSWLSFLLCELF